MRTPLAPGVYPVLGESVAPAFMALISSAWMSQEADQPLLELISITWMGPEPL